MWIRLCGHELLAALITLCVSCSQVLSTPPRTFQKSQGYNFSETLLWPAQRHESKAVYFLEQNTPGVPSVFCSTVVPPVGIEPTTCGLRVRCSTS